MAEPDDKYEGLRKQLELLEWPRVYPFKFIVPSEQLLAVYEIFEKSETTTRVSSKGKYISVTVSPFMQSPDDIINTYKQAADIEGLLALWFTKYNYVIINAQFDGF